MKKKNTIIIVILLVLLCIVGGGTYYILNKQDKNTLTILEKEWIDKNKNNVIDISIVNNVPIFNYEGQGYIYDFLDDLEKNTDLGFNRIEYNSKNKATEYVFNFKDRVENNDILIYSDNYALITNENVKYNKISDLDGLNIGVLKDDLDKVNLYINSSDVKYTSYSSNDEMLEAIKDKKVDAIVLPKLMNMETIIKNNLYISYNIDELKNNLVLSLGKTKRLNNILTKYYKKWSSENFDEVFGNYFTQDYYSFNDIADDTKVDFKSKRYQYGFVTNPPYDKLIDYRLVGYNSEVIKEFSNITGIEVGYKEYKSYAELLKDFNSNKLDLFFNQTNTKKYDMDTVNTISIFDEKVVVLSNINNNVIVNSINSLLDTEPYVISNTQIDSKLSDNKIKTRKFDNIEKLISKANKDSILVIDYDTYNMYKNEELKDYSVRYEFYLDTDYNYILRDIKDNKLFNQFFNFYLSFMNSKDIMNKVNYQTFKEAEKLVFLKPLIFTIFAIVCLLAITFIIKKIKENRKEDKIIDKDNKIKYIDMLTSLKNRNYLNAMVEKWDESGIYPQSIVIVDLNNIAYINDNYGHSEGDNVITEAANILIKNQLENSEIVRSNGNEFLIYLVEYDEKQIISYIKKLNKEFKELEHGFGAAIGYSMITDGLKTIDDAINEATLDMKANKEEASE